MTSNYDQLARALEEAGVEMSAAEAHGVLTGATCAPAKVPWEFLFFGASPPADAGAALRPLLQELQKELDRQLASDSLDFEPLLDEDATVTSLGEWARGFVYGLTVGGAPDAVSLLGEAGEFVQDAMRIGEVEADPDAEPETQAREIAEVIEYLRVGVQVVYEELRTG